MCVCVCVCVCVCAYVFKFTLRVYASATDSENASEEPENGLSQWRLNEQLYPCPVCGKVFGRQQTLSRHLSLHTGEQTLKKLSAGNSHRESLSVSLSLSLSLSLANIFYYYGLLSGSLSLTRS